jgi:glycosyltransferase involved in cell wall biosynthesis
MTVPLLILSDSPTSSTGLSRITRELAVRIHENLSDVFEVATFGCGGTYSRQLPFMQYPMTAVNNYVTQELPQVWKDFAGDRKGVVLTIWNPGWLTWMANPKLLTEGTLRDFLSDRPFDLWGYFPIDGHTANGSLPDIIGKTIAGFDRVLAYTKYGAAVMGKACERFPNHRQKRPFPCLPHGIDTGVFYPRDKKEARESFLKRVTGKRESPLKPGLMLIGVCATNSARKDWPLAFEVCSQLLYQGIEVGLWAHADAARKHWDLESLAKQFGMDGRVILTNTFLSDEDMAWAYSACDATLGIGSGEGWGYPLSESLACGVPVIHGDYAGGAEFVPDFCLVNPVAYRGDSLFAIERPVFHAYEWAKKILEWRKLKYKVKLPDYIDWNNAWPKWSEWLCAGLKEGM